VWIRAKYSATAASSIKKMKTSMRYVIIDCDVRVGDAAASSSKFFLGKFGQNLGQFG